MKRLLIWMMTLALCLAPMAMVGCEQKTPAEQEAEEMGDRIEDATDDIGGEIEDVGDRIEDRTD